MSKKLGVAFILGLALAFVLTPQASACYFSCVENNGCERCEYVGHLTGGYCQNSGACGCFDVQGVCDAPQPEGKEQAVFPDFDLTPIAAACSAVVQPGAVAPAL